MLTKSDVIPVLRQRPCLEAIVQFAYDQFCTVPEPTVEDLAKDLLTASGSAAGICFGHVLRQVDADLATRS